MSFYHSVEQINEMTDKARCYSDPVPTVAVRSARVGQPVRKILVGEWLSNHERIEGDQGWWCWLGARNFLFADGHVEFIAAEQINTANDGLPDANLTVDGYDGADK